METPLLIDDVRAAFRVVGHCRDCGHDLVAWNRALVRQLHQLSQSAYTASYFFPKSENRIQFDQPTVLWVESSVEDGHEVNGNLVKPYQALFESLFVDFSGQRTLRRSDLSLAAYSSAPIGSSTPLSHINSETNGSADFIISVLDLALIQQIHLIFMIRSIGGDFFSVKHSHQLQLIHEELGLLGSDRLLAHSRSKYLSLPPRLKQVFVLLMEGRSELEISNALALSKHTIHEYVSDIYRRFEVGSCRSLIAAAYRMGWRNPNDQQPN